VIRPYIWIYCSLYSAHLVALRLEELEEETIELSSEFFPPLLQLPIRDPHDTLDYLWRDVIEWFEF
jgi:hypothetical protein